MKEYILKADNRRPLKFSGELLGQSDAQTDEEITSSLEQRVKEAQVGLASNNPPSADFLKLWLYKTEGGKIVLHTKRFGYSALPEYTGFNGVQALLEVFEDLDGYIQSAQKKNGTFGYVTTSLMANVVSNHPELEEFWVETID